MGAQQEEEQEWPCLHYIGCTSIRSDNFLWALWVVAGPRQGHAAPRVHRVFSRPLSLTGARGWVLPVPGVISTGPLPILAPPGYQVRVSKAV